MILQFQIERKNKIENSSRTAWGWVMAIKKVEISITGLYLYY